MDKCVVGAMVRALSEVHLDFDRPCPADVGLPCARFCCASECDNPVEDIEYIAVCWKMAVSDSPEPAVTGETAKKKKMGKVTKALMKYATDGGRKTAYFCPSDAGLKCPYGLVNGEGCTIVDSSKALRKCWKKVYKEETCSTNE